MKHLVKICPTCRAPHSPDFRDFCTKCGHSHLGEAEPTEIDDSATSVNRKQETSELVRCAACGGLSQPWPICQNCNEALRPAPMDIEPKVQCSPSDKLEIIVGDYIFECRDGDILGKEGTLASHLFQGVDTVSRRHVLVTYAEGKWFITVFSGVQNTTQLNGQELRRGVPFPLSGESRLKMSIGCEIKLRVTTP